MIILYNGYAIANDSIQWILEKEKGILMAQIANDPVNSKKPAQIIEKMVLGRLCSMAMYEFDCT